MLADPLNYGGAGRTVSNPVRESHRQRSAEELGKRWRFFPTYACGQTSTVL